MSFKSIISLLVLSAVLSACGTAARMDSLRADYAAGRYDAMIAQNPDKLSNIDLLVAAQAAFQDDKYEQSDELFEIFNSRGINPTRTSLGREVGTLLAGQTAADYKPYMMDYLFVSYYQIWDALLMGNPAQARVIINQSYARQQKMSIEYKKLIKSRQKTNIPGALTANTSNWAAYSDIMNPALTYLSGIYFLSQGEYENARQYLARAAGMIPNNTSIKTDLKFAEHGKMPTNTAWVFIETGFAPRVQTQQINIPWPVGDDIQVISIASARPEMNTRTRQCHGASQLLADTDSMFLAEFNEYQINDALRSLAKATTNAAVQSSISDSMNGWGGVLGAVYSIATTNAEVRSWATLPQRTCLLRVVKDKSGLIQLPGGDTIQTDYSDNNLIYVRGSDIKQVKL